MGLLGSRGQAEARRASTLTLLMQGPEAGSHAGVCSRSRHQRRVRVRSDTGLG